MTKYLDGYQEIERFRVLGIPINSIKLSQAGEKVISWANSNTPRTVFVREAASLMAAVDEPVLADLHEKADLVVPDGMSLVWLGRMKGYGAKITRVAGADLVDEVCSRSSGTNLKHYFFGGKPGVAQELARRLKLKYPAIEVAGTFSPPMRDIGPEYALDDSARLEISNIMAAEAAIIWVGLSSPKQEYWMMQAAKISDRGVFIGVGAAFDFHSGAIQRAPGWLRNNGLEWLHRLGSEPARLWRRYLILVPRFAISAIFEEVGMRLRLVKSSRR